MDFALPAVVGTFAALAANSMTRLTSWRRLAATALLGTAGAHLFVLLIGPSDSFGFWSVNHLTVGPLFLAAIGAFAFVGVYYEGRRYLR